MQSTILTLPGAVDGETGHLVLPPDLADVSGTLSRSLPANRRELLDGIDPGDLAQAGWGILFAESDEKTKDLRKALGPLLKRRKRQAKGRYHEYRGGRGYRAGESKLDFLERYKAGPGSVDPRLVPYYLLLVGDPESIPYDFQYDLDLHHAVGRICFETVDEYARYADSVVAAEAAPARDLRRVTLFGPLHDEGTELTNRGLLSPLIASLDEQKKQCQCQRLLGKDATKKNLVHALDGSETPDLLFTAGHGLFYRSGHECQRTHQGALVCQDWPGDGTAPEPEHFLAAEDLDADVQLRGMLAFLFACNSAGTPAMGDFSRERQQAAPRPFVSSLAQRLLGHPKGGALAMVGHVEQVWRQSFLWGNAGFLPQSFIQVIQRLVQGDPLGWAMEPMSQRFADLSVSLGAILQRKAQGYDVDEKVLDALWIATRDARNYVIVGDPAVRLPRAAKRRVLRGG